MGKVSFIDWSCRLVRDLGALAKHDERVGVHDGDTAETGALLEGSDDDRALRGEHDLSHVVLLDELGGLDLGTTGGLLAHLPVDDLELHRGTRGTSEGDGAEATTVLLRLLVISGRLELTGVVLDGDLHGELHGLGERILVLADDVTDTGHVLLGQTLDVETDVVTSHGLVDLLVVHLDGEHLATARHLSVGRSELDLGLLDDGALLNTASDDITDTLDLVDTRHTGAHGSLVGTLRGEAGIVEAVLKCVDVDVVAVNDEVDALVPRHLLGLLHEVVTLPAGDGDEGELLLDLVLLVASGLEHDEHLSGDLIETRLQVRGRGSVVHLVDADDPLLDTEQVDETGVLTGLTLDLTSGTVALGDSLLEATLISGDHEKSDIGLAGTGNHVLDEVTVARGIDDGVVVLLGEELLGRARDGHTT